MPAFHAHDDDFLFEVQFPTSQQAKNLTAGNELLHRFLQRFRRACGPPLPRPSAPQRGVVETDNDISPMVTFPVSIERASGNFPVVLNGLIFRSNSLKT